VKDANYKPVRALLDLEGKFEAPNYWDEEWMNPKLFSGKGFHSSNEHRGEPYWLDVTMPDDQFYKVSAFEL
jgi:hypothetical protein